ncbi:MAG: serine hydrolase domain-containing protein [Dehalococcoidia bacterium]
MLSRSDLARAFDRLDREHALSGAVLIAQRGAVVFERAYGFASRQLGVPNTLDTKFHIASLTKMFVAMAALILSGRGLIRLHDRPAAHMPELAALDEGITLHHLLSHTSGLRDIYEVPHLRFEMSRLKHEGGDLLPYLARQPQMFRPGEGWGYSSTGYILMGYLMASVTGLPFTEVLRQHVLAPLSMENTGLDVPRRINPGRAYGHEVEDGRLVNADNDKLSAFPEAPGELYSTVGDLKKWCDAMFDCPLVSPRTLASMFTPHAEAGPSLQYGYGWFLGSDFRMHGGGTPGFVSRIRQYPDRQVSLILLLNSQHVSPETIVDVVEPLLVR